MPGPVHHPYDVTHSSKGQEHQGKPVLDVSRASSLQHGHVEEALFMLTLCPGWEDQKEKILMAIYHNARRSFQKGRRGGANTCKASSLEPEDRKSPCLRLALATEEI